MKQQRRRFAAIIIALAAAGLFALDWLATRPPASAGACQPQTPSLLSYPNASGGACWPDALPPFALAWFATPDTEREIMDYYATTLAEQEWRVRRLAPGRWDLADTRSVDGKGRRVLSLSLRRSIRGFTSVRIEQRMVYANHSDGF